MTYQLYKMTFTSSHFGQGSLESASLSFSADRLFSALFLESLKLGKDEELLALAQSPDFVLSDAFPYLEEVFLPKPIGYPTLDKLKESPDVEKQRIQAKKSKKLAYLTQTEFADFLEGQLPPERKGKYSQFTLLTKNSLVTIEQEGQVGLYNLGIQTYQGLSLYVIASDAPLMKDLLTSLQYSGLGGKRTSGYGRFDLEVLGVPEKLAQSLTLDHQGPVMLLTSALPVDQELEKAMKNGKYLLEKCSGFAFSQTVKTNLRKQDIYKFKAGSTFAETFEGEILDLRPVGFPHPVWHFAKPFFYKLEVANEA